MKALHVPFGGGAPAVTAAVGNHVDAVWIVLPTVTPHVAQGSLRGLGLASRIRNPAVPDVPTLAEMGFPDFYTGSWVGFFAPARTPDAVVTALNTEINAILGQAEAQERFRTLGFDLVRRECPRRRGKISARPCRLGQNGPRRGNHGGLIALPAQAPRRSGRSRFCVRRAPRKLTPPARRR